MQIIRLLEKGFIGLSTLAVAYVSITSMIDPISTMQLVNVSLPNNDAISSIRGIYGGVGMTMALAMSYLMVRAIKIGMMLTTMFWGSYAISRLITILVDGPLDDFGSQWMVIESFLCFIGLSLLITNKSFASVNQENKGSMNGGD